MDLNKVQDTIIEEFESMIDHVKSKFRYLRHFAEMGTKPAIHVIERTNEKLIRLTKSRIWLDAEYLDGKVYYYGDSDSKIIKGILALYIRVFSGRTPHEIINSDVYFASEISLHSNLSAERRNDVSSVLQRIRAVAAGYKLKSLNT
jgi:cysteine desulfuration protein SufE